MPTTATGEESPAILPTPKNLFEQTPVESTTPLTLLLKDIAVTTKDGWVCHKRIPELASLELAFELFASGMTSVFKIRNELEVRGLCEPTPFDINPINQLSAEQITLKYNEGKRETHCVFGQPGPSKGGSATPFMAF